MSWHKFIQSDIFYGSLLHNYEVVVSDRVVSITMYNFWTPDCCVRFEVLTAVLVNIQDMGYDTM